VNRFRLSSYFERGPVRQLTTGPRDPKDKLGVILDYDAKGNLVSLEILDASKRVTETRKIEFQTTE